METKRLKRVSEVFLVPLDKIIISEEINNARLDLGDIQELANSIKESELRTPILVKKSRGENEYVLVHGKRRLQAIRLLVEQGEDYPFVKCFCAPLNYKIEDSLFDQILLNDGKPYTSLEQGLVYTQLVSRGYNVQEIAKKTGKSYTHINSCISMATLPKKAQNLIADGSLSGLTAINLAKVVEDEDELVQQLEQAVESAPTSEDGKKKKVTNKNIERVATMSPIKKLENLKEVLKQENIDNQYTNLFNRLLSRLKAGESVESLVELFK